MSISLINNPQCQPLDNVWDSNMAMAENDIKPAMSVMVVSTLEDDCAASIANFCRVMGTSAPALQPMAKEVIMARAITCGKAH